MSGLDRHTGALLAPDAHLAQSIHDILSTRIGSRVMRRGYGSALPDIIDQPINGETLIDVYQATAEALDLWEPRLKLTRVEIVSAAAGAVDLRLYGDVDHRAIVIDAQVAA